MTMTDTAITVADLRNALERGDAITVLDIRKPEDRAEWTIPGSVHVDAYEALKGGGPTPLDHLELPRDRPVITVCGGGVVAAAATERLRTRGYDARTLFGGMRAWSLAWNQAELELPGSTARILQIRRTGKGCLSYLVGSDRDAAVIDPSLAPEVYQTIARAHGWTITAVVDTHVHADHLSRARLLAEATGAALSLPAQDRVRYPFTPLQDGDAIAVGHARLAALATPGHTPEAMTYLLDGRAAFTGDTLFLAGVGRPDLEAGADGGEARARLLHRSLRRLQDLPAQTLILPGHQSEPVPFDQRPIVATLTEVRARVGVLHLDEATFVAHLLSRLPPTPPNHAQIVALNEAGAPFPSDPIELEAGANRCAVR